MQARASGRLERRNKTGDRGTKWEAENAAGVRGSQESIAGKAGESSGLMAAWWTPLPTLSAAAESQDPNLRGQDGPPV